MLGARQCMMAGRLDSAGKAVLGGAAAQCVPAKGAG